MRIDLLVHIERPSKGSSRNKSRWQEPIPPQTLLEPLCKHHLQELGQARARHKALCMTTLKGWSLPRTNLDIGHLVWSIPVYTISNKELNGNWEFHSGGHRSLISLNGLHRKHPKPLFDWNKVPLTWPLITVASDFFLFQFIHSK